MSQIALSAQVEHVGADKSQCTVLPCYSCIPGACYIKVLVNLTVQIACEVCKVTSDAYVPIETYQIAMRVLRCIKTLRVEA